MPRYIASDATRTQYDEWAQSGDDENEMKHLDRRKTDLHRFLDPFTLLAIEGKTIYPQYPKTIRILLARYTQI